MSVKNQVIIAGIIFVALTVLIDSLSATEYPTPPPVPQTFHTANDVQRYLNQLHNYYMVVGRPRFGKRGNGLSIPESFLKSQEVSEEPSYANQIFKFLDLNGDNSISFAEFKRIFSKEPNSE